MGGVPTSLHSCGATNRGIAVVAARDGSGIDRAGGSVAGGRFPGDCFVDDCFVDSFPEGDCFVYDRLVADSFVADCFSCVADCFLDDCSLDNRACRQLSQMTLAVRWTAARKFRAVLS